MTLEPARNLSLTACYSRIAAHVRTIEDLVPATARNDLVRMGLAEALANAILHGALGVSSDARRAGDVARFLDDVIAAEGARGEALRIEAEVTLTPERVAVTLADPGPGFDWKRTGRARGRGLWILEQAFTTVGWNPAGNAITLGLVRHADASRAAAER